MRDYEPVIAAARACTGLTPGQAMAKAVELLWGEFGSARGPISWVGFYLKVDDKDEMVLVCREPKPACSPIGLHGMCGRSYLTRKSILVADVRTLGGNYIACDPKDQSELVIPLVDEHGRCEGVLDVDSYDVGAFDERDVEGMTQVLVELGLTASESEVVRL
ncbi:MAG TPA: GAF domain-containing protein [Phycisphaerales bacterium]|nr:GAF domain-containing protein [Phycisphaerales bacterium]